MGTAQIREHLHNYIDKAADAQVIAMYTLLSDKVEAVQERISITQYNAELEESEREYEIKGQITNSELIKQMKQW